MHHDPLDLDALHRLGIRQLRARYAELFGQPTPTGNKTWLQRRIAWRLQALAQGDLSERARLHAQTLAHDADLRLTAPPRNITPFQHPSTSRRTPSRRPARLTPGSLLTRSYKGKTLRVLVLPDGFRYAGHTFASLSAVARAITGSHCSGFLFFRIPQGVAS